MSTSLGGKLTMTRQISASPDEVFAAWTDATVFRQWGAPEGVEVADCSIDLTVGGAYHIRMRNDQGEEFNAVGVYRTIQPPTRLAFTWRWREKEQMPESLVTVELRAQDGGTLITLTHADLSDDEDVMNHEMGWVSCLNRLEALKG